jgi:iron complex outermembrane receptor protein
MPRISPLALALSSLLAATPALAQDAGKDARTLDTLIVTGTRVADRTVAESQSPIDIITPETLEATGTTELATALARALPSLNFPRPALTDGTSGVRPAQLRGLSPDQVLILVNGKRRHLASQLNVNGSMGRGSSAVDLNTIPVAAIERVEVLRDGASAQYGSDAIAGVVNIVLKGASEGGSLALGAGGYSAGDGQQYQFAGDAGVGFADGRGSLHLAGQLTQQDRTNRAGPYQGTEPNKAGSNFPAVGEKAFIIGDPDIETRAISADSSFKFNEHVQGYASAILSNRDVTSFAFFRSKNHNALTTQFYPDGYVPEINQYLKDRSLVAGLKGSTEGGFRWDVSYNYGYSRIDFNTRHTVNYSLGANSPTSFYDGALEYTQNILNADFSQPLNIGLAYPATLSFGIEYREEKWNQSPGEPDSYFGGGAQGFGGFTPTNAVHAKRHNYAGYLGLEADLTDRLSAGLTARYEDYSDFGSETSGKFSARYAFTDAVALRGTVATGFRAPSLAQQNYQAITSTSINGQFAQRGTFPATSAAAIALGAEPLYVTIDAYQIDIDDRIVLSTALNIDPTNANYNATQKAAAQAAQDLLSNLGISGVTAFNYFTNAIDTRTRGVDVVGTYSIPFSASSLDLTASYGYSKTDITRRAPDPAAWSAFAALSPSRFGRDEQGRIEVGAPRDKVILSSNWKGARWDLNLSATRYGEFTALSTVSPSRDQTFGAQWIADLSISYKPDRQWALTLGADNVLDSHPDQNLFINSTSGMFPYSNYSPAGFNGAYWYGRVSYKW